jgi:hypothetical protein
VKHDSCFVICGAATEQSAISFEGLKGSCIPVIVRSGRLHIVVRIQKNRGCIDRTAYLAVDGGMGSIDFQEMHVVESRSGEEGRDRFSGPSHLALGITGRAHGWDANQELELVADPGGVFFYS